MGSEPQASGSARTPAGNGWSLLPHPNGCRRRFSTAPEVLALIRKLDREIESRVFAGLAEGVGIPADAVGYVIQEGALTQIPAPMRRRNGSATTRVEAVLVVRFRR